MHVYNWFSTNSALNSLERAIKGQKEVIEEQAKQIENLEDTTQFLIQLLAENGVHSFECPLSESIRLNQSTQYRADCTCWIDRLSRF
jgi:hypothetical protein